ncbi:MAG: helix-hairpin-helix domain-containing protein, partial [Bacillota bacterium]
LISVGAGVFFWRRSMRGEVVISGPAETQAAAAEEEKELVVHVCGAVKSPGVYRLPAGARVYEAVAAAGGALPEADQEALNLAAFVQDGEQIRLPRRGEVPRMGAGAGGGSPARTGVTAGTIKKPSFPLNVNRASAAELEAVPGIGPTLAARIVAYRGANGPFASLEDLLNVEGIGEKTLARLRPYLSAP